MQHKMLYVLTISFFKSFYRNRVAFFFLLIFPLIFVGVFGIAFQFSDPLNSPIDIGIINNDEGVSNGVVILDPFQGKIVSAIRFSDRFISIIGNATYPNNTTKLFNVQEYNSSNLELAKSDLENRRILALVVIPNDFSIGFLAALRNIFADDPLLQNITKNWEGYPEPTFSTKIFIQGDQTLQQFSIASTALRQITEEFFSLGSSKVKGVTISTESELTTQGLTVFDYIFPGLVIFGILQTLSAITTLAMTDVESGLLRRIKITQASGSTYVASMILSQLILSLLQLPIMFLTGVMFGFPLSSRLWYGFVIAVILMFGITGIGFILAGIAKNSEAAIGLANIISVPMAFLAGSFFIVPNPELKWTAKLLGGNTIRVLDFLPATPAVRLMRTILLGQQSIKNSWFDLTLLSTLSGIYLIAGLMTYSKRHFQSQ